ncbi:MAG: hypothetical protein ACR2H4_12830 [Pyrinomonadaceae bacterium]|jgi:hypothetical protein
MGQSAAFVAHILKELGHDVPDEHELESLIQQAADELKKAAGLDPKKFEYKLVPLEKKWTKELLDRDFETGSRKA